MKKTTIKSLLTVAAMALCALPSLAGKYAYDSVPGDPLHTKAYTLPNGLKVFMTVNRDEPRIQTYIAVRVGGKNDPAETTGLAHYFEHLMFKGTEQFGTTDYAAEKPCSTASNSSSSSIATPPTAWPAKPYTTKLTP